MPPSARPFMRLQDFVLPPPLPALVAVLMVCGFAYLGWRLARRLRGEDPSGLDAAAGFVVVVALTGAAVHALALAQLSTLRTLRPLGWALALLGAVALFRHRARLSASLRREMAALWSLPRLDRAGAICAGVTMVALALAALGPPTDADSLDYHLGVPLDWLRHGGAYPRPDWFVARLVGIGESLNMLGVAAGTDGLGAALQTAGLVAAGLAVGALALTPRDRLVGWLLVAACPTVVFLVPSQKPQMLPVAATTVAVALAAARFSRFTVADAVLSFGCLAFAAASKLSFLLTGAVVAVVCLAAARRSRRLGSSLAVAVGAFAALLLPVLLRNLAFYGDPISPFLERFRPSPDAAVVNFARWLSGASGERTLGTLLRLPWTLVGTTHPSEFLNLLGVGALAFIPALRARGAPRILLGAALAGFVVSVALGQLAPRFFLETYLWAGAALVGVAPWGRLRTLLLRGLTIQGALTAAVAVFGAATLFPGAWTRQTREAVLMRHCAGYAEARWLDAVLPADAVVLGQIRSFAVSPRPFAVSDQLINDPAAVGDVRRLAALVRSFGVDTILLSRNDKPSFMELTRRCGRAVSKPTLFPLATRNPFNDYGYTVTIFRLEGCEDLLSPAAAPR